MATSGTERIAVSLLSWLEGRVKSSRGRGRRSRSEPGVKVPEGLSVEGDTLLVPWDAPEPARWLAFRMAQLVQRAEGYDFPSFPRPGAWLTREEHEWMHSHRLRVYLVIREGCAVAYSLVVDTHSWRQWRQVSEDEFEEVGRFSDGPRPLVGPLFVVPAWRGQGIARRLLDRIAADAGVAPSDIVGEVPLTKAGRRLALLLRNDGTYLSS